MQLQQKNDREFNRAAISYIDGSTHLNNDALQQALKEHGGEVKVKSDIELSDVDAIQNRLDATKALTGVDSDIDASTTYTTLKTAEYFIDKALAYVAQHNANHEVKIGLYSAAKKLAKGSHFDYDTKCFISYDIDQIANRVEMNNKSKQAGIDYQKRHLVNIGYVAEKKTRKVSSSYDRKVKTQERIAKLLADQQNKVAAAAKLKERHHESYVASKDAVNNEMQTLTDYAMESFNDDIGTQHAAKFVKAADKLTDKFESADAAVYVELIASAKALQGRIKAKIDNFPIKSDAYANADLALETVVGLIEEYEPNVVGKLAIMA